MLHEHGAYERSQEANLRTRSSLIKCAKDIGHYVMQRDKTPILLPSRVPELKPVENIGQYMRANWLSYRVFDNYDAIIEVICEAWNNLIQIPHTIKEIWMREYAHVGRPK